MRLAGEKLRNVLDAWINDELVRSIQAELHQGIPEDEVRRLQQMIRLEFGTEGSSQQWPVDLWKALLTAAQDPEQEVLPRWMEQGFPLGIVCDIDYTKVFPKTDGDTAAVTASRIEGVVLEDHMGDLENYKSFKDSSDKAQLLLDEMVDKGRATVLHTWEEVCNTFGPEAQLTKVGCLVKLKEDGAVKSRLIFDGRRSGVNGRITCRERVTLPRVSDVAQGFLQLVSNNSQWFPGYYIELFALDFKDAFNMLQLRADERKFVVMKGLPDDKGRQRYYVSSCVVFGVATGPLVWSRVAAAAMRLGQSVMQAWETDVHCYIDDPLIVSVAQSTEQHTRHLLCYTGLWRSLGLDVSWKKVVRGQTLQWIGFQLTVTGPDSLDMQVELAESKKQKLLDVFEQLEQNHGMIPLHLVQYAVGVLGWLSSAIPAARPWMAMLWAALTSVREPTKATTRRRKGLIFAKQVANALRWLKALLHLRQGEPGLCKLHCWRPQAVTVMIQTDASPWGLGAIIVSGQQILAYISDPLHEQDYQLFNSVPGNPSFQTEYELLAIYVALKEFAPWTHERGAQRVVLRNDNTSALRTAFSYKASSPIMTQLAAEIFLEMESQNVIHLIPQHLPGALNFVPDQLSRPQTAKLPAVLHNVPKVNVPARSRAYYRAWPER